MQGLTKKPATDRVEARFVGKPENILKFRRLAQKYGVIDVTDIDASIELDEEEKRYSVEEVFPELLQNRAGTAIRGYRYREGYTQKQLAELTGISQHHISEMENGKSAVGKERAKKLAEALKCDYRRFL